MGNGKVLSQVGTIQKPYCLSTCCALYTERGRSLPSILRESTGVPSDGGKGQGAGPGAGAVLGPCKLSVLTSLQSGAVEILKEHKLGLLLTP